MKQHTTLRMDEELLKALKELAKSERRSFTNYIEVALWDRVHVEKLKEPGKSILKFMK